MSNENKKNVSIWKARHKTENHPWVFFYAEDDQSFTSALYELNCRMNSQLYIMIYRSVVPKEEKKALKATLRKLRELVDARELGEFEFVRVFQGTTDDRLEGLTAMMASARITIEEAHRWVGENGYRLIDSIAKDVEKHSTGVLYSLARG